MKDVRRLLKRAKTGVFLLAFTTCVQAQQDTVFAGDINTEEARLLELMEQTIIQEDKTYEVTDDYMAKMRYYLMQDGVDYTAEQVSQKLAKITDVTKGLAEGYLREVVVPTKGSTNSTVQGTKNNPGDTKTEDSQSSEDTQQSVPDGSQATEKETTNKETSNNETTNNKTTNQESTNQEPSQNTTKQTVTNQESTNQESTNQESTNQKPSQNTTKQTTTNQETSNQQTTNQQTTPPKILDEDTSNIIPSTNNTQDPSRSHEEATLDSMNASADQDTNANEDSDELSLQGLQNTQDSNKAQKGTITAQEVQKLKESVTKVTQSNPVDHTLSIDVIGSMISSSGVSTTTMIAVGGGLLLLYVAGLLMAVGVSQWFREKSNQ